ASDFAMAVRSARAGRPGPVHLSLPTDVLEAPVSSHELRDGAFSVTPLPNEVAQSILDSVSCATRPLVLVGPACMTRSGRAKSAALEARWGVPVVGMESPRGVLDPS